MGGDGKDEDCVSSVSSLITVDGLISSLYQDSVDISKQSIVIELIKMEGRLGCTVS